MTDPSQTNLFDTPTDPDLIPQPGSEVLSKELSDKWQHEFYSTPIDRTEPAEEHVTEKQRHHDRIREMGVPGFISNKNLQPYIGSLIKADLVDVRKNHVAKWIEAVYRVQLDNGEVLFAMDPINYPNMLSEHLLGKMHMYLSLFPTKGPVERQKSRDEKSCRSLDAFFSAIRARLFRKDGQVLTVLIEPCMSVKGNVYLKIHNA